MNKRKVLLTGGGGRIGPHVLPALGERFDLRNYNLEPIPGDPDTVIGDLQDLDVLKGAMQGVEAVIHLAATSDEASFVEKLVPNNVVGLYNTFEAARQAGVKRLVFASTCQTMSAYRGQQEQTLTTTDPPRPGTLYGATKVLGEVMGRWFHDKHQIEFVGIRIGWFLPYDAPRLRDPKRGARNLWLSPRDAASLFIRAVEKENVGYALVYGTSKTVTEQFSLREGRELLDWEPADDVADIPLEE